MVEQNSEKLEIKPEAKESLREDAFCLVIDKASLEQEKDKIHPAGLATLEMILKLPEQLQFSKGTTLLVGPNASGKSTILGLIHLMGEVTSGYNMYLRRHKRDNPDTQPQSWEQFRNQYLELKRKTQSKTEWAQLGIAPTIAKHTTVISGSRNLNWTELYRVPEAAGKMWQIQKDLTTGSWGIGSSGEAVYREGQKNSETEILGSTQQIVDSMVYQDLQRIVDQDPNQPKVFLLDEPTSNADLNRTLEFFSELDNLNQSNHGLASFIVATNDGLLALDERIPRINTKHPEQGVHSLREYPLDKTLIESLRKMGYAPTNSNNS